ncbi:MAG: protein-export chaperone SecB, partial [Desulfococcaceae bacterium]
KFIRLHSIQLMKVNVIELYIKSHHAPDESIGIEADIPFLGGHTDLDDESRQISVLVKVEIGINENSKEKEGAEEFPFSLRVAIEGEFKVGEEFPDDQINDWARRNAPIILMPYLREHVYALTARSGFKPLILPLVVVPTLVPETQKE